MRSKTGKQAWFLTDPRKEKWLIQCLAGKQLGIKSDAPKGVLQVNFEAMFPVPVLNANGSRAVRQ